MSRWSTALERVAIVVASFVVAIGAIVLLSGYFSSRDQGGVSGVLAGPGLAYRDLGDAVLKTGHRRPAYDSNPPTSGAHVPTPVRTADAVLTDDQILTALAAGDVIVMYGGATPPPGLTALARSMGGPFSAALAQTGQAVILARLPGIHGIEALAWTRLLPITGVGRVTGGTETLLRQFIDAWLGRGAPTPARTTAHRNN